VWEPVGTPSLYWCIAAGIYIGVAVSEVPARYAFYFNKAIHVILVLSMSIVASHIVGAAFGAQVQRLDIPIPTTALVSAVLRGSIVVIGILVILGLLGISIAPLLTALGVGGLAVALALQDTLANLFAGFHILIEKSIRVGDFIKLESGQEGYVDDITWRTTRVRTLSSSMVMIPNKKLAQSVVVNYSLPKADVGISVPFRVGYSADFDRVEKILTDEAKKAVEELPGLVRNQEPVVSFTPGESWVDFSIGFTVKKFVDQYGVQNEVRRRIIKRFKEEGIEVPFPARTIYMKEAPDDGGTDTSV
jgi:small-conductance mechanosensitive channel